LGFKQKESAINYRLMFATFVFIVSPFTMASDWGTREIPTPLLTGNGFGFATYSLRDGFVSKFFAHAYRYEKPDPNDDLSEGIESTNVLKKLIWNAPSHPDRGLRTGDIVNDSHIISVSDAAGIETEFMPWGLARNVLITVWQGKELNQEAELSLDFNQPLDSKKIFHRDGHEVQIITFQNAPELLAVITLSANTKALAYIENFQEFSVLMEDLEAWQGLLSGPELVERELRDLEDWRVPPHIHFRSQDERRVWRHSEVMLRMGQIREPNRRNRHNHGLILAGLPDGVWVVPWVRDMTYALRGLIQLGHQAEAEQALRAFFEAQPIGRMQSQVGNVPYQISTVRYFGNGAEEAFFTMEGAENVEFDNWGLVLNALTEYVEQFHDSRILHSLTYRGTVYDSALKFVVLPLLKNLEPYRDGLIVAADTSIWEERQEDKKHFNYSSAAAIEGLSGFTKLAQLMGDEKTAGRLANIVANLRLGFRQAFIQDGALIGTLEGNYKNKIDSQVLESIDWGIITDRDVINSTVKKMDRLRVASGGYRRVRGDTEYEQHEFILSDINMARTYLRIGNYESAISLIDVITQKSILDHEFIPEMYVARINDDFKGKIGDPTGAVPLVGYGAGAYVLYLTEREQLVPPSLQ
jgi:hypothetical protein